jgi:hypothetical protein
MLCIDFTSPATQADYAHKREAAIQLLRQIANRLEKCPLEGASTEDEAVVGLCHEAANQVCHDMDLVTMLEW